MTGRLIWITGRAAAGKSTVIAHLAAALKQHRRYPVVYNDEDLLLGLVRADTHHHHHEHPGGDPQQIRFTTGHLFDESLRVLNAHLLHEITIPGAIAIVELARGRHEPPVDLTYRRALQLFDARLWPHSTVFRLDIDVDTQLARNAARHTGTGNGTPDEIMRQLYTADDPQSFIDAGITVHPLLATDPAAAAQRILTLTDLP